MPEKFDDEASDSAYPSKAPTAMVPAPRVVTMNNGSRPWIISEEMSISRLTKPRTQMSEGSLRSEWVGATCISIGAVTRRLGGCRVFAQQILETAKPRCHVGFRRLG